MTTQRSWEGSPHPARGRGRPAEADVLIVANRRYARLSLQLALPKSVSSHSVGAATDAEGIFAKVVVVGGDDPLAELSDIRVHPDLHDKPVVLFAPGIPLPAEDWLSMDVWPLTASKDAGLELARHVRRLMFDDGRSDRSHSPTDAPSPPEKG